MKKKIIILLLLILMLFSITNIYYGVVSNYYIKQLIWFILGFILIYLISKFNLSIIFKYSFYLYLLGNFLLLITLLKSSYINGARIWLNLGPFSFQPSEFMKIFLIIYLREFTKKRISDFKYIIFSFIIVLIPSILTFLEPDTGAVLIYLIIWMVFLVLKKLNKWYYIISAFLVISFTFTFFILFYNYQDTFINIFGTNFFYRMDRITNFLNGEGYQIENALKSTANAGLFGLKEKVYFPESSTDFALSLLISNFGLIGLTSFFIIYSLFFYFLSKLKSDKYLLYPVLIILLIQYSINVLMNLSLFPIMGITLPFLSYGGSSIISYMFLIGLIIKEKASLDTYL